MSWCLIKRHYKNTRDKDNYKVWSGKWLLLYPDKNIEILFDSWEELSLYLKENIIKENKNT
jgi:hypothetical protein